MKLNSVTRFLVNKLIKMDNKEDAYEYLESMGFDRIGMGSESTVYSRKGYDYVIKIQRYGGIKRVPCNTHFANQESFEGKNFNVIVQEKCEKFVVDKWPHNSNDNIETVTYKRWKKFSKFLSDNFKVYDNHDFNMGIKKGRLVSIDWNH